LYWEVGKIEIVIKQESRDVSIICMECVYDTKSAKFILIDSDWKISI
jgi:hypothetical protein